MFSDGKMVILNALFPHVNSLLYKTSYIPILVLSLFHLFVCENLMHKQSRLFQNISIILNDHFKSNGINSLLSTKSQYFLKWHSFS